jgi:hypothetical protein
VVLMVHSTTDARAAVRPQPLLCSLRRVTSEAMVGGQRIF